MIRCAVSFKFFYPDSCCVLRMGTCA